MKSAWIMNRAVQLNSPQRLFCFPFAGGGATFYRQWGKALDGVADVLPIQLPGRENRVREPLIDRVEDLVSQMGQAIEPFLQGRFSFFGYSMGALIAFELSRWMQTNLGLLPEYLFLAGRRPPHLPPSSEPFYDLERDQFWARIKQLEGTPAEIFEHPELLELLEPILRNDLKLCDTYELKDREAGVDVPIVSFAGSKDHEATPDCVAGWQQLTRSGFHMKTVEGGHFFINERQSEVLATVRDYLTRAE